MDAMTKTEPTQEERDAAARIIIGGQGFWNPGEDLEMLSYGVYTYDAGAAEYMILTDAEADETTADYIKDSLWAFRPSFLVNYIPEGVTEDVLQMIAEKCEDGNPAMIALIGDRLEEVISDAIATDGRGHFLSSYDGEEVEGFSAGVYWFGYRTN